MPMDGIARMPVGANRTGTPTHAHVEWPFEGDSPTPNRARWPAAASGNGEGRPRCQ